MSVAIRALQRTFPGRRRAPDVRALDGVDLDVRSGELLAVIGPSGSGKTTLLRAIAGLERLEQGSISIDGRDVTHIPAADRDIAMVFQDGALYPHLDVLENITFGLRARGARRDTAVAAAEREAAVLGIAPLLHRRPSELSAGERQRVALARAIVRQPSLFLLDEPLSSLDAQLRAEARIELRTVQRRLGRAMVLVTHDDVEAMALGDRVAVLEAGRVVQVDTPANVYDQPASPFVARLLGTPPINLIAPEVLGFRSRDGYDSVVGVRPERIRLVVPGSARSVGRVEVVEHLGSDLVVHVRIGGQDILVRSGVDSTPVIGAEVGIDVDDRLVRWFPSDSPGTRA